MLLRGELQIDAINSNFENFESAFYMKSVSMSLNYQQSYVLHPYKSANNIILLYFIYNDFVAWQRWLALRIGCYLAEDSKILPLKTKQVSRPIY